MHEVLDARRHVVLVERKVEEQRDDQRDREEEEEDRKRREEHQHRPRCEHGHAAGQRLDERRHHEQRGPEDAKGCL